ncbi:hypothetical protein JCM8547_000009 [Rhodosporidiobolus lusitaniae]
MPPFASKPVNPSALTASLRRRPFLLFGLPFLTVLVGSSFALSSFTQTRYDYRDQKVTAMSKEEELGMRRDRRKVDVREEYYRMQSTGELDPLSSSPGALEGWENKRVERLPGQAEWGELPVARKEK